MIFNQWPYGECMWFAILGALKIMNPNIDHEKIARELNEDPAGLLTPTKASKWYVDRGYIKWIKFCTLSPFLIKKQPIITGLTGVDWKKTGTAPYNVIMDNDNNSHWFVAVWYGDSSLILQNSWWQSWWDYGYFYSPITKNFKSPFILLI